MQAVSEENKPAGDVRTIAYSSSSNAIATVNKAGKVTFKTAGTVIITASKEKKGAHEHVRDTYKLYITMKPANKQALADEIKRAMNAHSNAVDLNYIDVSAITDMSSLFRSHRAAYGLSAFEGDISTWDVHSVVNMFSMFRGATKFNSDISSWNVSSVINMQSMFYGATKFNVNLNAWENKLNAKIKDFRWFNTLNTFTGSGLARSLPTWCENTNCKNRQ